MPVFFLLSFFNFFFLFEGYVANWPPLFVEEEEE